MPSEWTECEAENIDLREVEDLGDGSIPIPGKFLSCDVHIHGKEGKAVDLRLGDVILPGGPFDIPDEHHVIAIRGLSLGHHGNPEVVFHVRDAA